jgi:phosphoglycerate dehydrogenase-like enzyme
MSDTRTDTRPVVAVLIPVPMRGRILDAATERKLASFATVVDAADGKPTAETLPALLANARAAITGWGTPSLTPDVLIQAPEFGLVAHTAGSIHRLVPAGAIEGGLKVTHAAAIIADAVAELVIGQALRHLRSLDQMDDRMKVPGSTEWLEIRHDHPGRLLGEQTVGIVGTGHVGRTVISRFKAFGSRILASRHRSASPRSSWTRSSAARTSSRCMPRPCRTRLASSTRGGWRCCATGRCSSTCRAGRWSTSRS